MMQEVADSYQSEVEYELKTLGQQIEPILIVFLAYCSDPCAGDLLPIWDLGKAASSAEDVAGPAWVLCILQRTRKTDRALVARILGRASVLALIAGSLLTALLLLRRNGEAAVVQLTVRNIRSGLRYQIADRLVQGRTSEMRSCSPKILLHGSRNLPMVTSDFANCRCRIASKGSWFYDADRASLATFPGSRLTLASNPGGRDIAVARTGAQIAVAAGGRGADAGDCDPYRWFSR